MNSLFTELKQRNVFRVAGVYAVVGWILMQVSEVMTPALHLPDWTDSFFAMVLLMGFPIAVLLAWAFEMTTEGVKKTENVKDGSSVSNIAGRKLDFAIIGGLALVGALVIGDRLMPNITVAPSDISTTTERGAFAGQSIAVLAFEDFSPENDQGYFADGITEELLNVLARVDGLRVASRTSAFYYKGRGASLAEIGETLNVQHILEGSVRKAGNTLRITVQLIDTKSDEHLWSDTYDRPLTAENIFVIQDEISRAIVMELNGRLDLLPETSTRPTQSTEAFEAYLKGKDAYVPRTNEGIETAITELIRAVTLDPEFAVAHVKLARAYSLAETYAEMPKTYAKERASIHITRALELAPYHWDILSEYAWFINWSDENSVEQALAAFDVAIAANPNNAEAHRGKGRILGHVDEAIVSLERARALNPNDVLVLLNLAAVLTAQDNNQAARNLIIEAVRLDPTALFTQNSLGQNYFDAGEIEVAHNIWQSCRTNSSCSSRLGALYMSLGIEIEDTIVVNKLKQNHLLFLAGKIDEAAKLVPAIMDDPIDQISAYNDFGHWGAAYKVIQDNTPDLAPWLNGMSSNDIVTISNELAILAILTHMDDPRSELIRQSLTNKYQGVVPGDQIRADAYLNGAEWRLLENDPDGAMMWLNALADRGMSTPLGPIAAFEPLKTRADYQVFHARMENYKTRDRALIEAQMANPKTNWMEELQ